MQCICINFDITVFCVQLYGDCGLRVHFDMHDFGASYIQPTLYCLCVCSAVVS